ncbi:MAG: hypothetical protein AAFP79_12365 [Pseudomonadota bacterium]
MNASETPAPPSTTEELAAAMDWWRDAGVDLDYSDDVTAWLQSTDEKSEPTSIEAATEGPRSALLERREEPPSPSQPSNLRVDFFAQGKPKSLDEFREFWLTAPDLDAIGQRGRVPPRGESGAELMVLVIDPEQRDIDTLLSGPQGQLLDKILAATGRTPENTYFASALPRHTPMADTANLAAQGMGDVLAHHIALASPKRLMAFGAGLTPLLVQDQSPRDSSLGEINYTSPKPDTLVSEGLDSLMDMPRLKARFWRRWMEWTSVT